MSLLISALPAGTLLRASLPGGSSGGWSVVLQIYMDDSGTHAGAPVVTVGGLIGTTEQWAAFDIAWRARLAAPMEGKPALRKFSTSDCRARDGEFERYNPAERDLVTRLFRDIIKQSGVVGYASTVDRVAWDELVTAGYRKNMGPAEHFAVTGCVREILQHAYDIFGKEEEFVSIFYDRGRDTSEMQALMRLDLDRGLKCPRIVSFNFAEVEHFTPLQGADMVATESYWHAQTWLMNPQAPPRAHFQDYLETGVGRGVIMTRANIEAELANRNPDGTVRKEWLIAQNSS